MSTSSSSSDCRSAQDFENRSVLGSNLKFRESGHSRPAGPIRRSLFHDDTYIIHPLLNPILASILTQRLIGNQQERLPPLPLPRQPGWSDGRSRTGRSEGGGTGLSTHPLRFPFPLPVQLVSGTGREDGMIRQHFFRRFGPPYPFQVNGSGGRINLIQTTMGRMSLPLPLSLRHERYRFPLDRPTRPATHPLRTQTPTQRGRP
jgi:hypothetical protein